MPRTCSTCCVDSYVPAINTTPNQAFANMGYVGFVQLESALLAQKLVTSVLGQTLRVTNFNVQLKQAIEKPPVIDGRIDKTVYKLGPKEIEGTMSMPVIVDTFARDTCPTKGSLNTLGESSPAGRMLLLLWCWATSRNPEGRMAYDDVNLNVRYANHAAFEYNQCMVNNFTLKVAQQDLLTLDIDVMGRARAPMNADPWTAASATGLPTLTDFLSPARVLTWNDVTVTGMAGCSALNPGSALFYSNTVRSWDLKIANALERFYGLNGSLFPVDINAAVRDVSGVIEFMGLNEALRVHTSGNLPTEGLQNHFTEKNELRFAFYVGDETYAGGGAFNSRDWVDPVNPVGTPIFSKRLMAVVFQIEEMSLKNELYTTSVTYHAMAVDDDGLYEFVNPATSYFPIWYSGAP